ncbi:MAG TPA: HAMP domain-containing sensor histidine kinase [Acidimicrobiales bacterium]|nr:HAMP domain-containing sensor histidine kinase [Acidimicrobiales bacterium]
MNLRTRLTVTVTAIVAVAIIAGAYAVLYSTKRELRSQVDSFLVARADRFTRQPPGPAGRPGANGPGRIGVDRGALADFDAVVQVIDRNGRVTQSIADQPVLPVAPEDRRLARARGSERLRDVTIDGVHYRMLTTPLPAGGAIQVARSLQENDDVLSALRKRLFLIGAMGTLLAGLVAWAVARRTTKPIQQLTEASEHVAATQDLAVPIPVHGTDEVGRLAASFNTMLVALDTSRAQQRRLVVDASHELRTPLTAVRTNIEFLGRAKTLKADERNKLVAETSLELDELTTLVAELVELATDVRTEEPVEAVDLAEVAEDVANRFQRRTGREVTVTAGDAATIQGRKSMLDRAISNLVDNALKFSNAPDPVEVAVVGATVEVRDRGAGIADDDREKVFDRFYRASEARTLPGSGLGLAIVKQIAELHGGTVTLNERSGGGTVARLVLAQE